VTEISSKITSVLKQVLGTPRKSIPLHEPEITEQANCWWQNF